MRGILASAAILLVVTGVASCSGEGGDDPGKTPPRQAEEAPPPDRDRPADVSHVVLKSPDGETKKIADYSGRILMVHFFTTWHEDTGRLVEWMNGIQRKFGKNVDVLGLAMDREGRSAVKSFLARNDVRFEVFYNGEEAAPGFGGVRTLPTTYILLRDGTILHRYNGLQRNKVYEDFILGMYRRKL